MNRVIAARRRRSGAHHAARGDGGDAPQANTARLLEQNPTLMRLREIEALERWPTRAAVVVVGEGGLAGRVVKIVSRTPGRGVLVQEEGRRVPGVQARGRQRRRPFALARERYRSRAFSVVRTLSASSSSAPPP